jgi:Ca2+/Na+ antiporter
MLKHDGYFLGISLIALATVSSLRHFLPAIYLLFLLVFLLLFLLLFVVIRLRRSSGWNSRVQESVEDCGSKRRTVVYITPFLSLFSISSSIRSIQPRDRAFCEYSSSSLLPLVSAPKYPHGPLSPLRPKTHAVQQKRGYEEVEEMVVLRMLMALFRLGAVVVTYHARPGPAEA